MGGKLASGGDSEQACQTCQVPEALLQKDILMTQSPGTLWAFVRPPLRTVNESATDRISHDEEPRSLVRADAFGVSAT